MRSAVRATDGDLVLVALRVDGTRLVIEDALGPLAEDMVGNLMPIEESVAAPVLHTGEPRLVADYPVRGAAAPAVRRRIGSVIMAPLSVEGSVAGVLAVGRLADRAPFERADLDGLVALTAASADGRAIELAQAGRRIAGLIEERARIRDDLHDNVIQEIFAAGMALHAVAERLTGTEGADEVARQVRALDATTDRIRALISDLPTGSENPESMPLPKRLLAIVDSVTAALRCLPVVRFRGPVDAAVVGELALDLEAVLREALSNVARHAAATSVEVRVVVARGRVVLDVVDDGRGLGRPGRRSGLDNIARRAQRHGGELRLTTPEGGGTRLTWDVPLDRTGG